MTETFKALIPAFKQMAKDRGEPETMEKLDEVVYFESHDPSSDRCDFRGYVDSISLHLPVPFKPGDIITLDVRPFAPVNKAVVTETDGNFDCCGTQILYPNENGKYSSFALKHGHGFGEKYFPLLSSLYRAEQFDSELTGEKAILKDVSGFVKTKRQRQKTL